MSEIGQAGPRAVVSGARFSAAAGGDDGEAAPSADLFEAALANLPHGLCMFDAGRRLVLCNPAYAAMYRLPARLTARGTPLAEILAYRHEAGNGPADLGSYFDVVPLAERSGRHEGTRIRLVDGRTIQITHNPMRDGGYVAVHEDVTAHVGIEERLHYLAGHDQLTGLCNRHAFGERFAAVLAAPRASGDVAIHCLDLDRFKAVNDAFGHGVGDVLLQRVAKRMTACLSPRETAGRLGGDEFVLLQADVEGEQTARRLADRVIDAVARPYRLDGHHVSIGVSIGIAIHPVHGATPDDLLKNADRALYEAKTGGGNAARVFRRALQGRSRPARTRRAEACTA